MKSISRRRSPDNPTAAERCQIERRIRLLPLMQRNVAGAIDWPTLAGRLAEELAAITQRLGAARGLTDADRERVARAEVVLRDYQMAADGDVLGQ